MRPLQPDPVTRAHHLRIAGRTPIDTLGGPTAEVVLRGCFDDIGRRAEKLPARGRGDKLRGIEVLGRLLDYLYALAVRDSGDLVGVRRKIIAKLRAHFPDFDLNADALSDAFALLLRVGTCIVRRDKLRWTIRLAGLRNPRSALHRQLCKETEHGGGRSEAANCEAEAGAHAARATRRASAGVDANGGEAETSAGPGATARGTRRARPGPESVEVAPSSTDGPETSTSEVHEEEAASSASSSSSALHVS